MASSYRDVGGPSRLSRKGLLDINQEKKIDRQTERERERKRERWSKVGKTYNRDLVLFIISD